MARMRAGTRGQGCQTWGAGASSSLTEARSRRDATRLHCIQKGSREDSHEDYDFVGKIRGWRHAVNRPDAGMREWSALRETTEIRDHGVHCFSHLQPLPLHVQPSLVTHCVVLRLCRILASYETSRGVTQVSWRATRGPLNSSTRTPRPTSAQRGLTDVMESVSLRAKPCFQEVDHRVLRRHPPLERHATRAREFEPIAIRRQLAHCRRQRTMRPVERNELVQVRGGVHGLTRSRDPRASAATAGSCDPASWRS